MLGRARFLGASVLVALAALVACGEAALESSSTGESAILPNQAFFEVDHDGTPYRLIGEYFKSKNVPVTPVLDGFDPAWPIQDTSTSVLNRLGTPVQFASYGYYHTGFDVLRSEPTTTKEIAAPHDGLLAVFDWSGAKITAVTDPYNTIVGLYDPQSHIVTQLMHISPKAALAASEEPVSVRKGQIIGEMVQAPLATPWGLRFGNVQVNFLDAESMTLLNPAKIFKSYKDTVAPELVTAYVADANGKANKAFQPGQLDVIVETFDRDDASKDNGTDRQFEVSAIAYTITDTTNAEPVVLATKGRCELDHLYASVATPSSFRAKDVVDFGSAVSQILGTVWPSSDVANPKRSFRYALTQLDVVDGRCVALSDAAGFVDVPRTAKKLTVSVTVWDPKDNQTSATFDIGRGPPPDAGADAAVTP